MPNYPKLYEVPNYSAVEAALYLRLPLNDVRRWVSEGVVRSPSGGISFLNLLEIHILKGLRREFGLPLQRIRRARDEYNETEYSEHPFLDPRL